MAFVISAQDSGLAERLVEWISTPTWEASQAFLTEHAGALVTEPAEVALQQLIEDNPTEQVLPVHLAILQSARDEGIDDAYHALTESLQFRVLTDLLVGWVGTQSWEDARAYFDQHQEDLESDEAEAVIGILVADNPGQPDLLAHQGLLSLCRIDGADRAYGLLADPERLRNLVMSPAGQRDRHRSLPRGRLLAGLFPEDDGAQFNLALIALWAEDREDAERAMSRCAALLSPSARSELARRLSELADMDADQAPGLAMLRGVLLG